MESAGWMGATVQASWGGEVPDEPFPRVFEKQDFMDLIAFVRKDLLKKRHCGLGVGWYCRWG